MRLAVVAVCSVLCRRPTCIINKEALPPGPTTHPWCPPFTPPLTHTHHTPPSTTLLYPRPLPPPPPPHTHHPSSTPSPIHTHARPAPPPTHRHLVEKLNKKSKANNVKPFMVKNHLWVFINTQVENPAFDSQVREGRGRGQDKTGQGGTGCLLWVGVGGWDRTGQEQTGQAHTLHGTGRTAYRAGQDMFCTSHTTICLVQHRPIAPAHLLLLLLPSLLPPPPQPRPPLLQQPPPHTHRPRRR